MPKTNVTELRQLAITYLEHKFEDKLWYREPVATLVQGCKLRNGDLHTTVDAFGRVNGQILFANPSEVKKLIHHLTTYRSPYVDLREKLAHIEEELLTTHVAFLIGNQAMDFAKQDGVTEIEESIQANVVERRMNGAYNHKAGVHFFISYRFNSMSFCLPHLPYKKNTHTHRSFNFG